MDDADETESIEDLISTTKDPEQRVHAMELLNKVLELHEENSSIREKIARLEDEIQRLKDEKELMLGEENK